VKALQLQDIGKLALVEVDIPRLRDDQILVRTGASTICTSDLNDLRENPLHISLPQTLGHEGAGTVAAVGPAVREFKVGDRVATHPVHPCGHCAACRGGLPHLCLELEHFGINMPGTLAEYFVARADRARVVPPTADFALLALAEPVCVCLEALAQALLAPGGALLSLGDGPFGLLVARLAPSLRLRHVVMAGRHDFRLGFAGEAVKVNTLGDPHPAQTLRAAVGGQGYDAAILAVDRAQALADGLACLKPRGRLVVFASLHGATPIDLFELQMKELEIIGSVNDANLFDAAVRLLVEGQPPLGDLVTHRFRLDDYAAAFSLAASGKDQAIKVAFEF
jgi:threonine dehydrogenase-like Zn-dependent dehydrogenase